MTTAIKLSDIKIGDRVRYRVGNEREGLGVVESLRPSEHFQVAIESAPRGLAGLLRLDEIVEVKE